MKDIYLEKPLKFVLDKSVEVQSVTLTKVSRLRYQSYLLTLIKHVPKNAKVLDLGCGSGHIAAALNHLRPDLNIIGIDPNPSPLWPIINKYYGVKFKKGTSSRIVYNNETFDVVLSFGVMEHVHEYYTGKGNAETAYLNEVNRVLKKKGTFFVCHLPNKYSFNEFLAKFFKLRHHIHPYTKKQAFSILEKHKFQIELFDREYFIPSFFHFINKKIGFLSDKLYWLILSIDKILMLTPLKYFCQSFLIITRKK